MNFKRISGIILIYLSLTKGSGAQSTVYSPMFQEDDKPRSTPELMAQLDSLISFAVGTDNLPIRNQANYMAIRTLIQILTLPSNYSLSFDSIQSLSVLDAPDQTFRLFTWVVPQEPGSWRHFGCVLTHEKKPRVIGLIDQSDKYLDRNDTSFGSVAWYGQIYYAIVPKTQKYSGQTCYTLLGFDHHEPFSRRKMIDFLWFDDAGDVHFGAPLLETEEKDYYRYWIEYSSEASASLRYDEVLQAIVFDYLAPRNPRNRGLYFDYVPDGTFDAFLFRKKAWEFRADVDARLKSVKGEARRKP